MAINMKKSDLVIALVILTAGLASLSAGFISCAPAVSVEPPPPKFTSALLNGNSLVITLSETVNGAPNAGDFTVSGLEAGTTVTTAAVSGRKITLTLSQSALTTHTAPKVNYTQGAAGKRIENAAGNALESFADKPATNITAAPVDTTPPEFVSATVNGSSLVIVLSKPMGGAPLAGSFYLSGMSEPPIVTGAVVSGTQITLTLSKSILVTDPSPKVNYTKGTAASEQIKDAAGNTLGSFYSNPVTNDTGATAFTVMQEGGAAGTTPSTAIKFSFSAPVSGLTKADISITPAASVTTGDLNGSGTAWSLTLLGVSGQGDIRVSISKSGIESIAKTVTVYPQISSGDEGVKGVTFRLEQIGGAPGTATTAIKIIFSEPVSGLTANEVMIGPRNYNPATVTLGALTGSGTEWTIALTSVASEQTGSGGVFVSVSMPVIALNWRPELVVYSSAGAYYAVQTGGEPYKKTSTGIKFTFAAPVADLTANEITITGAGAPTVTGISGGGKEWAVTLSPVTFAQTVNVRINRVNIDAGVKSVNLYFSSGITFVPRVINSGSPGASSGDYGTLNTTAIQLVFSEKLLTDYFWSSEITITGGTIALTKGALTTSGGNAYDLAVTPVSTTSTMSYVYISVNKEGISPVPVQIQVFNNKLEINLPFWKAGSRGNSTYQDLHSVTYGKGKFLAASRIDVNKWPDLVHENTTSGNLTAWTPHQYLKITNEKLVGIQYVNGSFVMTTAGHAYTYDPTDNSIKTLLTVPNTKWGASDTFDGIHYAGGKYFTLSGSGNGIMAYYDGEWKRIANSQSALADFFISAVIPEDGGTGNFIAVGLGYPGGKIVMSTMVNGQMFWGDIPNPLGSKINDIASDGNRHYVAVAANGKIAYSTGGQIWTAAYNSVFSEDDSIEGVAYGNGYFVAVGAGGKIACSLDGGKTWKNDAQGELRVTYLYDVIYAENKFVAVGTQGRILYSDSLYAAEDVYDPAPPEPEPDLGIDYTVRYNSVQVTKPSGLAVYESCLYFDFDAPVYPLYAQQIHITSADGAAIPLSLGQESYEPSVCRYWIDVRHTGYLDVWISAPGIYGGSKRVQVFLGEN